MPLPASKRLALEADLRRALAELKVERERGNLLEAELLARRVDELLDAWAASYAVAAPGSG